MLIETAIVSYDGSKCPLTAPCRPVLMGQALKLQYLLKFGLENKRSSEQGILNPVNT
jgi:hypothetical protein